MPLNTVKVGLSNLLHHVLPLNVIGIKMCLVANNTYCIQSAFRVESEWNAPKNVFLEQKYAVSSALLMEDVIRDKGVINEIAR